MTSFDLRKTLATTFHLNVLPNHVHKFTQVKYLNECNNNGEPFCEHRFQKMCIHTNRETDC